jgi:RNA polymerase sigma factor (sigma-70 family)
VVRDLARARERSIPTDAELAARAAAGQSAAFDELYRRHAESAWRVAQAVAANADDAADAVAEAFINVFQALPTGRLTHDVPFRAYLLKATRNAAIDTLRRSQRVQPTGELASLEEPTCAAGPSERVVIGEEVALVAGAFRSLPERWRSVLWMTEIEGMPAREVAGVLGMSANAVAQLSLRARAGLRRNYLQAHVTNGVSRGCRETVDRLGAYVAGALPRRDIAKVERHVDECDECRARLADIEDLGTTLRRLVLPIPLGVATLAAGTRTARAAGRLISSATQRCLTGAAVVVLGLGIAGVLVGPRSATPAPVPVARIPAAAPATTTEPVAAPTSVAMDTNSDEPIAPGHPPIVSAPAGGTGNSSPRTDPPPTRVPTPPGTTPAPGAPAAQVSVSADLGVAGASAAVGIGPGACTNVALEPTAGGCIGHPAAAPGVAVNALGIRLP